jgi:hypothetical protein
MKIGGKLVFVGAAILIWPELSIVDTPNYADFLSA